MNLLVGLECLRIFAEGAVRNGYIIKRSQCRRMILTYGAAVTVVGLLRIAERFRIFSEGIGRLGKSDKGRQRRRVLIAQFLFPDFIDLFIKPVRLLLLSQF